jgi:hypothetical protein
VRFCRLTGGKSKDELESELGGVGYKARDTSDAEAIPFRRMVWPSGLRSLSRRADEFGLAN